MNIVTASQFGKYVSLNILAEKRNEDLTLKILVRLTGGLGNQIFQYAAGRSLAAKHNAELLLDDSLLKRRHFGVTPRGYALDVYDIRARKLHQKEKLMLQFRVRPPFRYLFEAALLKTSFTYYREPHFDFDPQLHQLTGNLILEGYWQSERYFLDIADDLWRELQPISPPSNKVQDLLRQMQCGNSVSLHIRRGDYISNPKAAAFHVVCDYAYYQRAIKMVTERVVTPVFFVFTDDPDWVAKDFRISFPLVLVSRPDEWPAYEDLRLMSHCSHHIIANSSFGWWGAWLNPNPDKIVVAPSQWFRGEKTTRDRIPYEWNLV